MQRPSPTPHGNAVGCVYLSEREAWQYLAMLCEYSVAIHERNAAEAQPRNIPNDDVTKAAVNMRETLPLEGLCLGIDRLYEERYVAAVPTAMLRDPADQNSGTVGITRSTASAMRRRLKGLLSPTPADASRMDWEPDVRFYYWWDLQAERQLYGVTDVDVNAGDSGFHAIAILAAEQRAIACGLLAAMSHD
jgi:hypothetical protein